MNRFLSFAFVLFGMTAVAIADVNCSDWEGGRPDACTSITVGRSASADGSVITSHTCDSHRTTSAVTMVKSQTHPKGSLETIVRRMDDDSLAMPAYRYVPTGTIPQIPRTFGYINTAYPCMNERQLAVGESTFGGRESLRSDSGLIDCQALVQLMMERTASAREGIRLAGDLVARYGWNDEGECLTIADPKEVWHFEIVGPGKDRIGGNWVARRVPDGHVAVNANASRIRQIDLSKSDEFMASDNVTKTAQDSGWWNPTDGPFEFCYAYDPEGRQSLAARRREWRVLDLAAPSLKLQPESENYPFSVKPDTLLTLDALVLMFQDYYEGTDFNFVKNITAADSTGKMVISPLANPFMPYDMNPLFKINGGWGWRGERPIARWYTMYATITQSRSWLPDAVGGVVWVALDNVASSIYVPVYASISDLPKSYQVNGRVKGFSSDCAWWAFNRLGTLAAQRWGDMRKDVTAVWSPLQREMFAKQSAVEAEALALHSRNPEKAKQFLTRYTVDWGNQVVKRAWEVGDFLWTKYDEKW